MYDIKLYYFNFQSIVFVSLPHMYIFFKVKTIDWQIENNLQVKVSMGTNYGRRRRRRRHRRNILCFLISQRTQHLRHENTCVVVDIMSF